MLNISALFYRPASSNLSSATATFSLPIRSSSSASTSGPSGALEWESTVSPTHPGTARKRVLMWAPGRGIVIFIFIFILFY